MNINLNSILTATSSDVSKVRNKRLIDAGFAASLECVESIRKEKRNLEEKIEDLMTFSATTDLNAGIQSISNADMNKKMVELHKLMLELELVQSKLDVATKVHAQLSGEKLED